MSKILSFCSLLGKIISIYFIMFLVSLMCVTFSPINKNNAKKRCNIESNSYEYSFLENIKEIKSYNVYFSCNTIDIVINTEFNDIKEVAALSLKISKYLDKYNNLQLTINGIDHSTHYVKIKEKGVVIII